VRNNILKKNPHRYTFLYIYVYVPYKLQYNLESYLDLSGICIKLSTDLTLSLFLFLHFTVFMSDFHVFFQMFRDTILPCATNHRTFNKILMVVSGGMLIAPRLSVKYLSTVVATVTKLFFMSLLTRDTRVCFETVSVEVLKTAFLTLGWYFVLMVLETTITMYYFGNEDEYPNN